MTETVYRLAFKNPLYVGTWGMDKQESLGYIPSDTLFAALVVAWRNLGILPQDLAALPLRLTSAFPFAGEVRFFPQPMRRVEKKTEIKLKTLKKATWVSETLFGLLRQEDILKEHLDEKQNFMAGGIWLTTEERKKIIKALDLIDDPLDPIKLWQSETVSRVTIDRVQNSSNLFFTGRFKFIDVPAFPEKKKLSDSETDKVNTDEEANAKIGLWFAVRHDAANLVEKGLNYLQDAGLGGLRSIGYGGFTFEKWSGVAALPEPAANDAHFISLARLAPVTTEFDCLRGPGVGYKLVNVRGWCQDDSSQFWRRRQVRLIEEGACLAWNQAWELGQLVDTTPDVKEDKPPQRPPYFVEGHKVYRYGRAFPVKAG